MMSFYDTLKSLVDKFVLPRKARKGARRVGDPCRMPCRIRKEVWFGYLKKKSKISGGGVYVLQVPNMG